MTESLYVTIRQRLGPAMTSKTTSHWLKYLAWGSIFVWYAYIGKSTWPVKITSQYSHGWVSTLVLATWLVVLPFLKRQADTKGMITGVPRILLIGFGIVSFALFPMSSVVHPIATSLGAGLFVVELWLLTRRWSLNRTASTSQKQRMIS